MDAPDVGAACRRLLGVAEEVCARLHRGDDVSLDAYTALREALTALLGRPGVALASTDLDALMRALALDRTILTLLAARAAGIRRDLEHVRQARSALASYREATAPTPPSLDRLS